MPACRTCTHPERERIEFAIANCVKGQHGAMSGIAAKYGIPRASLERHRDRHMTQDQIARLRFNAPDATDQKIEDVIRQEGENAILGLRAQRERLLLLLDELEKSGSHDKCVPVHRELRGVYELLAKYAGMVPGRKTVTNNNLLLGDITTFMDLVSEVLKPFPEARKAVAAAFASQQVLEHKPDDDE